MIHYDDLYYGNLSGGQLDGYCAVTLELGGSRSSSVKSLASSILSFSRTKIFRLMGDGKQSSPEDLEGLITILRENNYIVVGVFDGKMLVPWMEKVNFRVVEISEESWLLYAASEIHFKPLSKENIEPPSLTEAHTKASCYLDISRDMSAAEVFDFLKKYPLWRLYSPPSKTYRMALSVKED